MRKVPNREVYRHLSKLTDQEGKFLTEWVYSKDPMPTYRSVELMVDIIRNNPGKDHVALYEEYRTLKTMHAKHAIKYGIHAEEVFAKFQEKIKHRKHSTQETNPSVWSTAYWLRKGFSEEESVEKVKEVQANNAKKRSAISYHDHKEKLPWSADYWLSKGHTAEEAEDLRMPHVYRVCRDKTSLVNHYGEKLGNEISERYRAKAKETTIKNYHKRRSAGYVSKASIKIFVPIYKKLRRLGIQQDKLHFGIKGSREYFIRDNEKDHNTGKFYDFCVSELNIIVEFHGLYWHPRDDIPWRNNFYTLEEAQKTDAYAKELAARRGFTYLIIWEDDDQEAINKIVNFIEEKWNEYRSAERKMLSQSSGIAA